MFLIFTENGKVLAKVLAKLCKHFSNVRKTFPNFSRSRQKNFNFNLGPLKDLDDLVDEVLALDSVKSYLRKQVEIGRTTTGYLNKSAALATFQKKSEKSCIFLHRFGNPALNRD